MDDFPPISKEDPPEVHAIYVYEHFQRTGEVIKYNDIPDTMYGAPLKVASKKRKSKKAASEAAEGEASEPKPKKAKKEKTALQVKEIGSAVPTIHEEVKDLEPVKVLNKRTRGGTSTESSRAIPPQPKIQKKKKKKKNIRKMKVSNYVLKRMQRLMLLLISSQGWRETIREQLQRHLRLQKRLRCLLKHC